MAGITGLGTTYTLPNYTGILFQLTPADTPFFSAIGGLSNGGQTTSIEYEWETFDLRNASQVNAVALEGQAPPTAQSRVRANVTNVCQIHQEQISVSYTKQAAYGQKNGTNNAATNPITNEVDWQTLQMLKQMVRDIEFSFINGVYNKPTDNTTKRQTRGLLPAIAAGSPNYITLGTYTGTGLSAATNTITETATPRVNGDKIVFTDNGGSATLVQGKTYYVVGKATNTFQVANTLGGSPVTIGTATVSYSVPRTTALTTDDVNVLLQSVYDNGGIAEAGTATLMVGSSQKRAVTKAYASAYGQYRETSRTVGGVSTDNIITDFGDLAVMLNRHMPSDAIAVVSMEQCMPVFLEVPGKGHMFAEPLAKTGASDQVQLYGEVGLAYGNVNAHGLYRGLAV
jgi:hypothetical protein